MLILGHIDIPLWFFLTSATFITIYIWGTRNHDYFKKRGIPGPKPWPVLGTFNVFFTHDFYTLHRDLKKKYGKVYGLFNGTAPELVVFDEGMISQITVKQFQNFIDRRVFILGDDAYDKMITTLSGEHWRYVRSQMSPAFTTGKLRLMAHEINRSAHIFAKCLIKKNAPFEARESTGAFTIDVIASTAFGLRVDSQEDENSIFMKHAKKLVDFDLKSLKTLIIFVFPWSLPYFKKMGYSIADADATDFFKSVVDKALEGRAQGDQKRADFLQMMVKAQQGHDIRDAEEKVEQDGDKEKVVGKNTGLSRDEILANALLFFIAGYDTVAIGLSKLMYLLACNQDCQQKLIEEIDSVIGDKEDIDYNSAIKMPYVDQCIQETLRIYPPAILADRVAAVDTDVCGIKIEKGTTVVLPIIGIHQDSEIWPEPEKFDPERFSPENKANRSPLHWIPFGYGPRNCIGMRLALLEVKIAIATVLRTHKLVTCEKTDIPLKLSATKSMKAENGVWLALEKRTRY